MRPPSSGGRGNKLNTASTTLMISAFLRILCDPWCCCSRQVIDEVEGERGENSEHNVHGRPGRSYPIMSRRGLRSALKLIGTGLA